MYIYIYIYIYIKINKYEYKSINEYIYNVYIYIGKALCHSTASADSSLAADAGPLSLKVLCSY